MNPQVLAAVCPTMEEREVLLDRLGLREVCLIHYDIEEGNVRARTALNRFVFGRVEVRESNGSTKEYRYPGLVTEGAERIGQSVFMATPDLANRLIEKLRELGVQHSARKVYEPS